MFKRILFSPDADVAEGMAANADAVIDAAPVGNADPAEPAKEPENPDITKVVAKRIKEESEKISRESAERARQEVTNSLSSQYNAAIVKLGLEWEGKPVTTLDELNHALEEKALREQAAEKQIPVEILTELQSTKTTAQEALNKLSQYERKDKLSQEAERLAADEKWGKFFKENEPRIRELADKFNVDLGTAKLLVYDEFGPQTVDEDAIENRGIQKYIEKKKAFKPVEGTGAAPVTVAQTPKTWAEARDGARAYLQALREK